MRAKVALVQHLGGVGERMRLIWAWSVHGQESGDLQAQQSGLIINDDTNTKIIVDNIFSWSELLEKALLYMECQFCICLRLCQPVQILTPNPLIYRLYPLSLTLKPYQHE